MVVTDSISFIILDRSMNYDFSIFPQIYVNLFPSALDKHYQLPSHYHQPGNKAGCQRLTSIIPLGVTTTQ